MNLKTQKFSFRTIKGYGLAGAVIASVFLSQGVVAADTVKPTTDAQIEAAEQPRAVELGSVVATHYDTNGNQLALNVTVKEDAPAGEGYTTSPKVFDESITTNTINGLTRKTYAHYDLVQTPGNASGKVAAKETITIPYIYKRVEKNVTNGSVVAMYVDTEGNELAPSENIKTNVEPGEAYSTHAKNIPVESLSESKVTDDYVKVTTTGYELVETPDNQNGEVKDGEVTIVKYVYKKVTDVSYEPKHDGVLNKVKPGSVIAMYVDTEGNEVAPSENIKTNAKPGESYSTRAKNIPVESISESKPTDDYVKVTTTGYELVKTPDNQNGEVKAGEVTIVKYVYKKVTDVSYERKHDDVLDEVTPGSVIAMYVDTEGNEVAPSENIKTNAKPGESYSTHAKNIPVESLSESKLTENLVRVTTTEYKLVKTPDNQNGEVKAGEVTIVKYVYKKLTDVSYERKHDDVLDEVKSETPVVEKPKSEVLTAASTVDKDGVKVTRYLLEDRKTEIQPSVIGLVGPTRTIGNYKYTGATDSDRNGTGIAHIYKLEKPITAQASPILEKPEFVFENDKEAPVLEKPEFKFENDKEAPVLVKPEFKFENDKEAPVLVKPEFKFENDKEAPVLVKPEFKFENAKEAPVLVKPEFKFENAKEAPVLAKPEFKPEKGQDKPQVIKETAKKSENATKPKELPKTGVAASATGLIGVLNLLGATALIKGRKE